MNFSHHPGELFAPYKLRKSGELFAPILWGSGEIFAPLKSIKKEVLKIFSVSKHLFY